VVSAPAGETTLYYHNHNWQVLTEYDNSNNLQRKFIYGNGTESPQWRIDEVLLMKAGENDYYYAHDHLYSPAALIDSSGTVLERCEYDAYGNCSILEPYSFLGNYLCRSNSGSGVLKSLAAVCP